MKKERATQIEMIPIDRIAVVNPRSRGQVKFRQIVDNISTLGLKKPITVAPRRAKDGVPQYDLVCGQGRLEAYQALGQREVPAFVVDATKDELMLMSLAENLARRVRSAPELMANIVALKDRGYTLSQIAKKTDLESSYVHGILRLIAKGEDRLLRAVERQDIPLSIAVTIAGADEEDVQRALADAYTKKTLRGKELLRARRLIEMRHSRGKRLKAGQRRRHALTADALLKVYERETERQSILIKEAKLCEARLRFVTASLRQLLGDADFVAILREQALHELPQNLSEQIYGKRKTG